MLEPTLVVAAAQFACPRGALTARHPAPAAAEDRVIGVRSQNLAAELRAHNAKERREVAAFG